MPKYGLSLTLIFPYKDRMENPYSVIFYGVILTLKSSRIWLICMVKTIGVQTEFYTLFQKFDFIFNGKLLIIYIYIPLFKCLLYFITTKIDYKIGSEALQG